MKTKPKGEPKVWPAWALPRGTLVRVRPVDCDGLGIDWTIQGGEGRIVDTLGDAYVVEMNRKGKRRTVRREGLVVHRNKGASNGSV